MATTERWEKDLRAYRLARHMTTTHGESGPPPGTPNRRHLLAAEHDRLHDAGLAAHSKDAL